jgi:predicted aspartyl protease
LLLLLALVIAPISNFGAAKNRSVSPQLAGCRTVRVHYGPMNQMIMRVRINGQQANVLVDTGSNEQTRLQHSA